MPASWQASWQVIAPEAAMGADTFADTLAQDCLLHDLLLKCSDVAVQLGQRYTNTSSDITVLPVVVG